MNNQEREDYKHTFDKDHQEYKDLQAELDQINKRLADVDRELDNLQEGSPQFLVQNSSLLTINQYYIKIRITIIKHSTRNRIMIWTFKLYI